MSKRCLKSLYTHTVSKNTVLDVYGVLNCPGAVQNFVELASALHSVSTVILFLVSSST